MLVVFALLVSCAVFAEGGGQRARLTYSDYVARLVQPLPEIKGNEINLLSAENHLKSSQGSGNIALSGGRRPVHPRNESMS